VVNIYIYHQFNTQQFYVLLTQCICMFCVDLRTNSDYFPSNINWLVFITETECVYCAVRTASLCIIQFNSCISEVSAAFINLFNSLDQLSSGMLRSVDWQLVSDVSGQPQLIFFV